MILLIVNGYILATIFSRDDDERQWLLENGTHDGSESSDKNCDLHQLWNEQSFFGYIKSFAIFLPYILPRHSKKAQVRILALAIEVIAIRFLKVLTPQHLGRVIEHLQIQQLENLPWHVIGWVTLVGLQSPAFVIGSQRVHSWKSKVTPMRASAISHSATS